MRLLSKSKLLAYRQCPKRLWLEVHRPELREDSAATQASFMLGHEVGERARALYDPRGVGELLDPHAEGFDQAVARTQQLLARRQPIFEAAFRTENALALADVMLPSTRNGKRDWRMIEVKSSTEVKDYHLDDVAVQSFVSRSAGVVLTGIALAHIDSSWVYPGAGDYTGLLRENDLTSEAFDRHDEVCGWVAAAHKIVARRREPAEQTGEQCLDPYECGFLPYCQSQEPQAQHPVHWLPRRGAKLKAHIAQHGLVEIRDVPDHLLNDTQRRVKAVTLSGKPYFDRAAAARELAHRRRPAYFLDFETVLFAVPIWKGTRPYQQIPFQFSVHRLSARGKLTERSFLDLSGGDPSRPFAEALIQACGEHDDPIFVYNAAFEKTRIRELAERFPRLAKPLRRIIERIVDLLPIARAHYYHPSQEGSWSIKAVLPAVCPDLSYDDLVGVQDGGMAMQAYRECIAADTTSARKAEIKQQLLAYCRMDTYAMVRLWSVFSNTPLKG